MSESPALRYYRRHVGSWSGRFGFRVTSWRALAGAGVATMLLIGPMALLTRIFGPSTMSTRVEAIGRDFRHTTRVSKWGVTLYETEETIAIDEDGRTVRLAGTQGTRFGRPVPYEATAEIDDGAMGAVYRIPWMGVGLVQRTRIVPDGLELVQETPWSHASVVLRGTSARAA